MMAMVDGGLIGGASKGPTCVDGGLEGMVMGVGWRWRRGTSPIGGSTLLTHIPKPPTPLTPHTCSPTHSPPLTLALEGRGRAYMGWGVVESGGNGWRRGGGGHPHGSHKVVG